MAIVKGYSSPTRGPVTSDSLGFNGTTSILRRDIGSAVFHLDPSVAVYSLLTDKSGSASAGNPRFEWYEDALRDKDTTWDATGTGLDNATTEETLSVADSNVVQVGDVLYAPVQNEILVVKSQTDATTYEVARAQGGSTATTGYVAGDAIVVIGSAFAEGVDVPPVDEWQEVHKFNFDQIFRRSFGASETREATDHLFGKPRARLSAKKAIEHAMDIERALLFGGRSEVQATGAATPAAGTGVLRTTGGFRFWATSNVLDLNGAALSEPNFEDWMEDVFEHTSAGDSRVLLCSAPFITVLDQIAVNKIQTVSDPNLTYGIAVRQYRTAHGNLSIVKHRLLKDGGADYATGAIAVDFSKMKMRPLRPTRLLKNRQDNGVDGWVDEYLTETGLQFMNAEVHGSILAAASAA